MSIPFQATPIASLAPYVDARNDIANSRRVQQPTLALDGKNFFFDALGPKSGFATHYLTYEALRRAKNVHSRQAAGYNFIFTLDAIMLWRTKPPYTLNLLAHYERTLTDFTTPWNTLAIGDYIYLFHPEIGGYKSVNKEPLRFVSLWDAPPLGIIEGIVSAFVVRGRAILLNETTIQWSAVGSLEDLTPSLGGAGIQIIDTLLHGELIAAYPLRDGFIIWTTEGSIKAEYVGGDVVWRFVVERNVIVPMNQWSVIQLPTGDDIMLTNEGLYTLNGSAWTPEFNEYFRVQSLTNKKEWRLDYDNTLSLLFLSQIKTGNTLVLTPTIDKWGVFSRRVQGFVNYSDSSSGYIGHNGDVRYFTGNRQNERLPNYDSTLFFYKPRIQKNTNVASSSIVCNSYGYATALAGTVDIPKKVSYDAWWGYRAKNRSPRQWGSLDAELVIGYLRPQSMSVSADGFIELQEMVMGTPKRKPPKNKDWTSDWYPNMYAYEEDWNIITTGGIPAGDWNAYGVDVDWNLSSDSADWNLPGVDEDWLLTDAQFNDDWESDFAALPEIDFSMSLESSEDGITYFAQEPQQVRFNVMLTQYSVLTRATYHKLKISANGPTGYFHITYLSFTDTYGGQLG